MAASLSRWLKVARRRDIVRRSAKVSAVVGTVLTAINQGDLILAGNLHSAAAIKIVLTYCVPYLVSTHASVSATLAQEDSSRLPSS